MSEKPSVGRMLRITLAVVGIMFIFLMSYALTEVLWAALIISVISVSIIGHFMGRAARRGFSVSTENNSPPTHLAALNPPLQPESSQPLSKTSETKSSPESKASSSWREALLGWSLFFGICFFIGRNQDNQNPTQPFFGPFRHLHLHRLKNQVSTNPASSVLRDMKSRNSLTLSSLPQLRIASANFVGVLPWGWTNYDQPKQRFEVSVWNSSRELGICALAKPKTSGSTLSLEEFAVGFLKQMQSGDPSATWDGRRTRDVRGCQRLIYNYQYVSTQAAECTSYYAFWETTEKWYIVKGYGLTKNVLDNSEELSKVMDQIVTKADGTP